MQLVLGKYISLPLLHKLLAFPQNLQMPKAANVPETPLRPIHDSLPLVAGETSGSSGNSIAHPHTHSESCTFCTIARAFPPSAPLSPPTPSPNDDPVIFPQAHIIISTSSVLAFLDIQPLARGHVLVCPRDHVERITDMTPSESCRVGAWLPVVARAVMKIARVTDFNVIQNNGIYPIGDPTTKYRDSMAYL